MQKLINKLFNDNTLSEQWSDMDNLEFESIHGDETCNECGVDSSDEYCKLCYLYMEL